MNNGKYERIYRNRNEQTHIDRRGERKMKVEIDFETEECDTHYYTVDEKTGKKLRVSITEPEKLDIKPVFESFKDQLTPDSSMAVIQVFADNIREAISGEIKRIGEEREKK